jgi:phospholipase C
MSFYNEDDLAFYYALAETFAINDRYFSSVLGPTFPNRAYLMAATSFGHLTSDETLVNPANPLSAFYQPLTGTIFDLLDRYQVSWANYFVDGPQGASFRNPLTDPHFRPITAFFAAAQAGTLPAVAFVDAARGGPPLNLPESDEHPGPNSDLRLGQQFVAQVVSAVRNGPNWADSIVFITYDEHGGFYDHVAPPAAPQGGARTPDGIAPGQCADASHLPASAAPGGGQNCTASAMIEASFCPGFTAAGSFPGRCAAFNQLGFRVPFIAVSPFAKPHYVSHTVGVHASLLALIEKRFLHNEHLTLRDAYADTLEDLFDFSGAPSLEAPVFPELAPAPVTRCVP